MWGLWKADDGAVSPGQGNLYPDYVCQQESVVQSGPLCLHLPGQAIDAAVAQMLLEKMNRLELGVSLAVQQEIVSREAEADALRAQQVTRAQYQADLAGLRYRQVDPNHRLVASTLEAEWNAALRELQEAKQTSENHREKDRLRIDEAVRAEVLALSSDFPAVWNNPHTTNHDRKRLVRLLIEDVTLSRPQEVILQVRFRGGATQTLTLAAPQRCWEIWETAPQVVEAIDELLNDYTGQQVAEILNERSFHPGKGGLFLARNVAKIRRRHGLKSHYERLRAAGMLTTGEISALLGVHDCTAKLWYKSGLLRGCVCDDKGTYLFEPPGPDAPIKQQGQKLESRRQFPEPKFVSQGTKEVQYES